jgi:hypothetical protein
MGDFMDSKIRMNLQLFAEPAPAPEAETTEVNAIEQVKTYTEDEVKAQVQAETDRKVTKALETAKAKWLEEEQVKLKQAEELAKLSEKERLAKELEIQRNEFEQEKSKFQRERLTLQTEKDLISKDMPVEFAPFVVADTAEQTLININTLQASWQAAIEKAIDDKVKGRTPTGNQPPTTGGVTKEQFEKMNYLERLELKQKNLKLYESLL